MSKPLIALLKVGLSQNFDFRKKDKAKNASLIIPLIIIFIGGSLLSLMYSLSLSFLLKDTGNEEQLSLVLYAMVGVSTMLALVTGITKTKGTLFGGNDYDMLASLPVSKRSIIFVKLFCLYLVHAFYAIILILPTTLVICVMGKQPLILLDGLLCLILSPILPLILSGLLGLFVGVISDRFKFGNIITILFYILFLGLIMYSSFAFNSSSREEEYDPTSMLIMLNVLGWFNPTTQLLALDVIIIPRLLYILLNLILLIGMVWVFAKCYDYFHFLMTSTQTKHVYKQKQYKQKGQFKALLGLDFKRYFTSKMYLLNTITGGVISIICTVIMIVSFTNIKDPEAVEVLHMIAPYFVLIIVWCVGMSVPSSVAINMEGKSMWQIKSLPINYQQYSLCKILLSYIVLAPFVLISSIVLFIYTQKTVLNGILVFVTPQIYLFSMCLIGYFINLFFYKLKWNNETEAVKNSAGTLISMLIDFVYTGLLCVALLVPSLLGFQMIGVILTNLVVIGLSVTFALLIKNCCTKQITAIEC